MPHIELWYSIVLAVISCIAIAFGLSRANVFWTCWGVAVLLFSIGMYGSVEAWREGTDVEPPADYTLIEATLKGTLASGPGFRTVLLQQGRYGSEGTSLPGYGRLIIRQENFACKAGDQLAFSGRIRKPRNRGNPGEFDWELDCRNNGIYWLASVRPKTQVSVVSHGPWYAPGAMLFVVRDKMNVFLDSAPSHVIRADDKQKVRAILKAIVIGDLGEVGPRLYKSFADSGLAHTLSASGIHVGMVALLATCLATVISRIFPSILLWIPFKKAAAALSIPAMIFYCVIVGGRVPAIRATIMGLMIGGAFFLERRWQSPNALAFAAVLVLFLYPLSILTPSFLLSFSAVAGIILVSQRSLEPADEKSPPVMNLKLRSGRPSVKETASRIWRSARRKAYLIVLVSLGAVLATLPTTWYFFRSFPLYTLLANLFADCLMTGALGFGLLASTLSLISTRLSVFFLIPSDVCAYLVIRGAETFSGLPFSVFRKAQPDRIQLVLITLCAVSALFLLGRVWKKRSRVLFVVMCLSGSLVFAEDFVVHSKHDLEVYFLNVGKGDSIFLRPGSSKGILIDGGVSTEYFDAGTGIVVPFLYWAGVSNLHAIVMTHPDTDHIGGLASIIDYVAVEKILWNPVQTNSLHLEKIFTAAQEKKLPIAGVSRDSSWLTFGEARLRYLNVPAVVTQGANEKWRMNNTSVVMRLDYGQTSFLFTGDLEREGEDELVRSGLPLKADVLKIGHHGSKNSSSLSFLKAVAPKIAVISADYPKTGGLPSDDILHRLASFGIQVYWTGRDGAVTMVSDGQSLNIRQGRKSPL